MKKETIFSLVSAGLFLLATAFLIVHAVRGGACCKF